MSQYDYLFKFILIGDSGKSCLLLRFASNKFIDKHEATLGVSYETSVLEIQKKTIKLQIWDTAGQQTFQSITRSYYKGAIAVLLVYDITRKKTFENVKNWVQQIQKYSHQQISIALIGNKSDLKDNKRQIQQSQAIQYSNNHKFIGHYLVSALSGQNIRQPFQQLTKSILHKINQKTINLDKEQFNGIKIGSKNKIINQSENNKNIGNTGNIKPFELSYNQSNNQPNHQDKNCSC